MQKCLLRSALILMWLWNKLTWFNLLHLLFKWKCHPLLSVGGFCLSSLPLALSLSPSLFYLSIPLFISLSPALPLPYFFSVLQPPTSHIHTPTVSHTHALIVFACIPTELKCTFPLADPPTLFDWLSTCIICLGFVKMREWSMFCLKTMMWLLICRTRADVGWLPHSFPF